MSVKPNWDDVQARFVWIREDERRKQWHIDVRRAICHVGLVAIAGLLALALWPT